MSVITRRELLRFIGSSAGNVAAIRALQIIGLAGMANAAGCKSSSSSTNSDGIFTNDERSALGALADAVLPPDQDPGGKDLGAVPYIENLIATIESGANEVFANGPFSGRQPLPDANGNASTNFPPNDFANWVELDRVNALAWKIKVLGSSSVKGGAPNDAILGPVIGLRDQLHQIIAQAVALSPKPLASLSADDLAATFQQIDSDSRDLLVLLVTQAAFAAPEYGGNPGLSGWKMCNFEGDSQPLGYSQWNGKGYTERPTSPMSTANPGADPAPLDANTEQLLALVTQFLGGVTS
jgi:Gluconate 2-dehydrogenase subunit 3